MCVVERWLVTSQYRVEIVENGKKRLEWRETSWTEGRILPCVLHR